MSSEAGAFGVLVGLSIAWGAVIAWTWHRYGGRLALVVCALVALVVWAGVVAAAGGQP